jgi:DNA topoisomerase-1
MNPNYKKGKRNYYCKFLPYHSTTGEKRQVFTEGSSVERAETVSKSVEKINESIDKVKENVTSVLESDPINNKGKQPKGKPPLNKLFTAIVFRIINLTSARIGTPSQIESKGTYGISTLLGKHVTVKGDTVELKYVGKYGRVGKTVKYTVHTIDDPQIVKHMRAIKKLTRDDEFIFSTKTGQNPDGPINAQTIHNQLKGSGKKSEGFGFPKDVTVSKLRNYAATRDFTEFFTEVEDECDEWEEDEAILKFYEQVDKISNKLGNSREATMRYYIIPETIKKYFEACDIEPPKNVKTILEKADV